MVVKFGGSSLADYERISKAATAVAREYEKGSRIAVIVSAIGKTTDLLLDLVNNSCGGKVNNDQLDDVLAMGERTSARIFAAALEAKGVKTRYFDPSEEDWPIITDDAFSNASPVLEECDAKIGKHVLPLVQGNIVPIIPGYIGRTPDGRITTLGRGGSDTTAFILAKALNFNDVVLVTDSDGIMSADPKVVDNPRVIPEIDVNILMEIADSSAKFIHRKALKYKDPSINVKVINYKSGELSADGTKVVGEISKGSNVTMASPLPVTSITLIGKGVSGNPDIIHEVTEKVKTYSTLLGLSADCNSLILYVSEEGDLDLLFNRISEVVLRHDKVLAMSIRRNLALIKTTGMSSEETGAIIGEVSRVLSSNKMNLFGIVTAGSGILISADWQTRQQVVDLVRNTLGRHFYC
jgi:aspartate kinase